MGRRRHSARPDLGAGGHPLLRRQLGVRPARRTQPADDERARQRGAPVVLLNGRRISSFSEIRDIPTEAIQRVEILPEEVALKYGYRADQKVVNFVLRRRFRAVTAEAIDRMPTEGARTRRRPSSIY
ncbi:TonB-dependent receptor plug domain-containing protein [Sphingomonas aerolata]